MRRRRSTSAASGMVTRKGRIAVLSVDALCDVGSAATCVGSRPRAPTATEAARIAAAEVASMDIIIPLAGVARLLRVNSFTHDDEPLACRPGNARHWSRA